MKKCLIISGGDFSPILPQNTDTFIIACDKGYEYAKKSNIQPNLILGDFDSYEGSLPKDIKTITLPKEKDDTDTLYAVKYAIEKGYRKIELTCALGSRIDHTLGNIQCALYALSNGAHITISEQHEKIHFLQNGSLTLDKNQCYSVSVLSASEKCTGVSIKGAKYEIDNATITNTFPIGISNEWKSNTIEISVKIGVLIIITT